MKDIEKWLSSWVSVDQPRKGFGFDYFKQFVHEQGWCAGLAPNVITVAGTNGKGSCVTALHALCRHHQQDVLSFTSPHLHCLTERFIFNDNTVDPELLMQTIVWVNALRPDYRWSFFETLTLVCFRLATILKPKVLLLEVGLGGRLDCVNATDHHLAIITNIDLDHTEILGHSIDEIAREKAGIIRKNCPVVWGDGKAVLPVIRAIAEMHQAPCITADFSPEICGALPRVSLHAARLAWQYFLSERLLVSEDKSFPTRALYQLLNQISLAGRLQIQRYFNSDWVFDVAHNPAAFRYLCLQLKRLGYNKINLIANWSNTKDILGCVEALQTLVSDIYLLPLPQHGSRYHGVLALQERLLSSEIVTASVKVLNEDHFKKLIYSNATNLVSGGFVPVQMIQRTWLPKYITV